MFRGGPFPLAYNRESSAIDDEMDASAQRNPAKPDIETLATP